jgi:hypothetical protein
MLTGFNPVRNRSNPMLEAIQIGVEEDQIAKFAFPERFDQQACWAQRRRHCRVLISQADHVVVGTLSEEFRRRLAGLVLYILDAVAQLFQVGAPQNQCPEITFSDSFLHQRRRAQLFGHGNEFAADLN